MIGETARKLVESQVAVIGDIMIDIYIHGDVERISPEAPVPVVRWASERAVPGGAANVVANILSLGARATLVGVVGADGGLDELSSRFSSSHSVDLSTIVEDASRHTTRKTRLIGHRQQLARIDHEDRRPLDPEIESMIISRAISAVDACDIVVLSDYEKGLLTDRVLRAVLDHAACSGKITIVDPKRVNLAAYRGASIITPNRAEMVAAIGLPCDTDEETERAARLAQNLCDADIVLTRAEKGISYFPRDGVPTHLPTVAREVFDVSGAGDTVIAVLASALARTNDVVSALKVANHAAGIVVGKAGTATLTHEELLRSLAANQVVDVADGRLVALDEAVRLRTFWEEQGYTVGVANGCFDLLHPGHISLIRQSARNCDRLIVALNSDASVSRLKGQARPIQDEASRANVIGALKGVALVVIFEQDTPYDLIEALQPDVLIKGADYIGKDVVGSDIVLARGGEVIFANLVDGQSTTRLIAGFK